jgi:hypothetical protein
MCPASKGLHKVKMILGLNVFELNKWMLGQPAGRNPSIHIETSGVVVAQIFVWQRWLEPCGNKCDLEHKFYAHMLQYLTWYHICEISGLMQILLDLVHTSSFKRSWIKCPVKCPNHQEILDSIPAAFKPTFKFTSEPISFFVWRPSAIYLFISNDL